MAPDLGHAVEARRSTASALYPTRGVGPGRLGQDAGITGPCAGEITFGGLADAWSVAYHLAWDGREYTATRAMTAPPPPVTARTLEGLESGIRGDWSRWCDLSTGGAW